MLDSPQAKPNLVSSIKNFVFKLPDKMPNDLRLRILENQEMLEKSQIYVKARPCACNNRQKEYQSV